MQVIKLKKGLNLPIKGAPKQEVDGFKTVKKVAVLGDDYPSMKPTMEIKVGDKVKLGQLLFTDKKMASVNYTAPGCGKVIEVNRGAKRHFQSIVIELDGDEEVTFKSYSADQIKSIDKEVVIKNLIDSGLWTLLRSRPMGKVADPTETPGAVFVNAMDTNPLAADISKVLEGREESFKLGLHVISKLTDGKLFLTKSPGADIPGDDISRLEVVEFDGPHPAGLVGTHIHFLYPVSRQRTAWYANAQDVASIGDLFSTGKINVEKTIAIGGPGVKDPRLIKTRTGACISELMQDELNEGENRLISGSVFAGTQAAGPLDYLGRYDQQISVIPEGRKRNFFGWAIPNYKNYSVKHLAPLKFNNNYEFTTEEYGGHRPIIPIGSYDKVMPLDVIAAYLLRAVAVDDLEEAEFLGCLELVEEDLGLCSYVCPSKIDHGENLRRTLTIIEKEG